MNVKELIASWEKVRSEKQSETEFTLGLSKKDAARVEALVGLYPGMDRNQILSQLITTALDEVERQMPYKPGKKVVSFDELGDPLYEDIGLTPKYLKLLHQYSKQSNKSQRKQQTQ